MTNKKFIDGNKFRTELAKLVPNYGLGEDNDGQIIIYTNMQETTFNNYTEMEESWQLSDSSRK